MSGPTVFVGCDGYDMLHGAGEGQRPHTEYVSMFPDTYAKILKLAFEQLIGNISLFLKYWAAGKLVLEGGTTVTKLIKIPSSDDEYPVVRVEFFIAYITKDPGT